jgi:pyruvate dehydrogenase E2 component (dihydrolipoamide acetyltransferase)
MAKLLRMPGISADAEEVVFLEWSVKQGSQIVTGEAIATVETEKANVDIIADQNAVLWRSLIEPGASVNVGAPIAILIEVNEKISDESAVFKSLGIEGLANGTKEKTLTKEIKVAEPVTKTENQASNNQISGVANGGRIFASPLARKLAKENNVSVANIIGTGPGQRIVRADVEKLISNGSNKSQSNGAAKPVSAGGYVDIPHTGMRRAVARTLSASKREAPHFYLNASCKVDALLELRKVLNEDREVKLSINDFMVMAVIRALHDVPEMNVIWMEDFVRKFNQVDVSVAISSSRGLVTPVIRSGQELTLSEISKQIKEFAQRANNGELKQHEIEGGSFSVTNLGMFGVESFSAIINPPQVGILAIGAVVPRPAVMQEKIFEENVINVTLSVDHRPVDGVLAAKWLQHFKKLVENPVLFLAKEI